MKQLWLALLLPLLLLALLWWLIKYIWTTVFAPDEAWRLAVSVDQLANAAFNGNEDETISSRAGRHCSPLAESEKEKWACILCKILDKIEKDHCSKNIGV
jgi:hypothetical protein